MKIYDCFTFFNELDLLEMRLNILDEVVDYFVLVEATTTFQNMGKPLYFEENKKRYEKFLHKIIHIIVDDMPSDKPFENEYFQRNAISRGLINCNENDIIIISDVDEIPNPEAIKVGLKKDFPILFNQKLFYYYLNNLCVDLENFPCSAMIEFKNLDGIQDFRDKVMDFHANIHKNNFYSDYFTLVENGGWHFSYLGGIDAIIKKIESFAHDEYNNKEYKNYEKIEKLINSGKDIFGRDLSFKIINIEENFPKYIIDNQDKYEKLVYQDLNKVMLFDQYSRYSALVSIMKKCLYTSNDTILDIGCGHDHLLEQFFEKNSMFFVDPLLEEEDRNKYINGYIFDTRLDNRKFDYVTAIDVLEHIPFDLREKFIERMCELSNKYVILAFPSSENEKAVEIDKSVNEEYKRMYNKDYPWLEEHFAYDLPSLSNLKNQLKTLGWNVTHIGHGYAPWLKEMMNTIVPTWDCLETHELLLKFSKDFNENLAKYDFNEPYYREFVVASKGVLPDLLNLKIDIDEKSKSFFDIKIKE